MQKLEIINDLEIGENRNFIMYDFNISFFTIYDKQKELLKKFAAKDEMAKNIGLRYTLKKPKPEIFYSVLCTWFNAKDQRKNL